MRKIILFLSIVLSTAYANVHAQAVKASPNAQTLVVLNYDKEQYTISDFLAHKPVISKVHVVEPSGAMLETLNNAKDLQAEVTFIPTTGNPLTYTKINGAFDAKNKSAIQDLMKNGGKITFTNLEVTTAKGKKQAANPYTFIIVPQQ